MKRRLLSMMMAVLALSGVAVEALAQGTAMSEEERALLPFSWSYDAPRAWHERLDANQYSVCQVLSSPNRLWSLAETSEETRSPQRFDQPEIKVGPNGDRIIFLTQDSISRPHEPPPLPAKRTLYDDCLDAMFDADRIIGTSWPHHLLIQHSRGRSPSRRLFDSGESLASPDGWVLFPTDETEIAGLGNFPISPPKVDETLSRQALCARPFDPDAFSETLWTEHLLLLRTLVSELELDEMTAGWNTYTPFVPRYPRLKRLHEQERQRQQSLPTKPLEPGGAFEASWLGFRFMPRPVLVPIPFVFDSQLLETRRADRGFVDKP